MTHATDGEDDEDVDIDQVCLRLYVEFLYEVSTQILCSISNPSNH